MKKKLQLKFAGVVLLALVTGLVSYPQAVSKITPLHEAFSKFKINLGLDLQGGAHLEYSADTSKIDPSKISEAIQGAQDVIERRVNPQGVGETLVQTAKSGNDYRLIVEIPGKDAEQAKKLIGEAPSLEFKEEGIEPQLQPLVDSANQQAKEKARDLLAQIKKGTNFEDLAKENSQDPGSKDKGGDLGFVKKGTFVPEFDRVLFGVNLKPGEVYPDLVESQFGWHIVKFIESKGEGADLEVHAEHILIANAQTLYGQNPEFKYKSTGLTGKNLLNAQVGTASQGLAKPEIDIQFDSEGTKLFAEITKRNVGKTLAIFLDGKLVSNPPRVNEEITGGRAQITGDFTLKQVQDEVRKLNQGSLPVPLTLIGQQSVEASLGAESLNKSLIAGVIGLGAVIIFMLVFYRFLGLVASLALLIYTGLMITIFKLFGVTLSLSGIAGFILSIGMAVDANVLIFERTKEEIRNGRTVMNSLDEGFKRAWTSIRDGNISSLLTAGILYLMGTGFVKGFAASLFIGVVVSMFTAVVVTRTILKFIISDWIHERTWLVGVRNAKIKNQNEK